MPFKFLVFLSLQSNFEVTFKGLKPSGNYIYRLFKDSKVLLPRYVLVALRFSKAIMFVMDDVLVLCDVEPGFHPKSLHVGFVKEKVALGRGFFFYCQYFGIPLSIPFHQCSILIVMLHATLTRTKKQSLGTLNKPFRISWSTRLKMLNFFCIIHL